MPIDTPVSELVRQLSRVGLRPDERLVQRILEHGPAARAALLELALNTEALHAELPAALGPLHALRLLGELPDVALIVPLLGRLPVPITSDEDVPAQLYATEILQIIGRIGAPAVEPLWAYADDEANLPNVRSAAVATLAFVAARDPECRDTIIAEGRRRLEHAGALPVTNGVATLLAELGDAPSYAAVMAAFRAGQIEKEQVAPATLRQFMLGGGRRDLSCVNHPLFERYDDHGPRMRGPNDPADDPLE
jgi:hypothetical protein